MAIYGIKAVKYCLSKNLLHYVEADAGGGQTQDIEVFNPATGQCTVTNPLTVLPCLVGSKATLTVDDAVVNRRHQYTARLTFVTADNPNLDSEYYAFVVETNEGEQLLLGSKVAPRCSVTTRQNVAATAGDINGYTTTVDFKAPYAPLRLPVTTAPVTDTREFDICCGAIKQGEPISGPAYDVCCGEIQGEVPPPPNPTFTVKVRRTTADAPGIFVGVDSYVYNNAMQPIHRAVTLTLPVLYEQNITFTMFSTPQPYASEQRAYYLYFAIADPSSASFYNYQVVESDFSQIMAMFPAAEPIYNSDNIQVGFSLPGYPPAD